MKLHELLLLKKDFGLTRVAFLTACLAIVVLNVEAQSVPPLVNYQGRLTDAAGSPLPAGNYSIAFRFWDKPSVGAAQTLIWGREYPVTIAGGGIFNVILGAPGGQDIIGAQTSDLGAAFAGSDRFLGIMVTKDSSGKPVSNPAEILPRPQILSTPFALRTSFASNAASLGADGLQVSTKPSPNALVPLDGSSRFPASTIPFTAAVGISSYFKSAEVPVTLGGTSSATHGLGGQPVFFVVTIICKTAEFGYAVGDEVLMPSYAVNSIAGNSVFANPTSIGQRSGRQIVINRGADADTSITAANWRFIFRAWR